MSRSVGSKNRSSEVLDKELYKLIAFVQKAPKKGRSYSEMRMFVATQPTCITSYKNNPLAVHVPFFNMHGITKCADGRYRVSK